jgi:hypothetical protein
MLYFKGALKLSKAEIEQQRSLAAKIRAVRRRSTQKSKENIDSNEKKIYHHASSSQSTRPHNKRPYTESLASTDDEAAGEAKGFAEIEDIVMVRMPSVPNSQALNGSNSSVSLVNVSGRGIGALGTRSKEGTLNRRFKHCSRELASEPPEQVLV